MIGFPLDFAGTPRRGQFAAVFGALPGRLLVLCVMVALAMGGRAAAQDLRVGVRAGPSFGFLSGSVVPFVRAGGDGETHTNVRVDFHAGGYGIVPLTERVGLQGELLYVRKGAHISRVRVDQYRVERYRLSYLQGQVLGRRSISLPGPLHLHAVAGFTLGRFLGGTARRNVYSELIVFREEIDLQAQELVRAWDFGGLLGMGVGYPLGESGRLTLALRYNPGFRSVFTRAERAEDDKASALREPPPLSRVPPGLRNDLLTASLSYTLSLDL